MERRALLAAVLCLVVLVAYQEVLRIFYPMPVDQVGQPGSAPATVPLEEPSPAGIAASAPAAEAAPAAIPAAEPVLIETDLFTARVAPVGGRITSLRLKKYRTAVGNESEPLEMIQVGVGSASPLGVRLASEDGRTVEDDTKVVYGVEPGGDVVVSGSDTRTLTLRGTLPSGAVITKALVFSGSSYPIGVEVDVTGTAEKLTRVGIGWRHQIAEAVSGDPEAPYRGTVLLADKKVLRELASALTGSQPRVSEAPVGWVGYADHYFLAALIPGEPGRTRATVSPENGGVQVLLSTARESAAAPVRFTIYVGPKDVALLEGAGFQLERAVDFGWFSFLAIPLLRLMKVFHSVTGNYGVDIILLTILIKVLFIPLTNRSMKSMRDMQRLQPQMAKLREKYKDDRETLNKEMIELYRRHRVNPLGGCLPMLLQFPVFIGLYQALSQAIELRHAPFAFWVHDLSAHECYPWPGQGAITGCNEFALLGVPIPILVLLMGGSMILQQWLAPATGMDPAQQRMMMILMPIMFTVMFINFPSGLVLYWLINNVLTIAQQWWSNREPSPATS